QLAFDVPARAEAERALSRSDQISLLKAELQDFDMAAGGLDFAKPQRPGLWREILQPADHCPYARVERLRQHRMQTPNAALVDLQHAFDRRRIRRRAFGNAAVQLDMFGAGERQRHRLIGAIDARIIEYQRGAFRCARQADNAAAADPPISDKGGLRAA